MPEVTPFTILSGPFNSDEDFTLVVLRHQGNVAFGRKTRGFGEGKLVLPGGKTQYYLGPGGVSIKPLGSEASREVGEEIGLTLPGNSFSAVGMLAISSGYDERTIAILQAHLLAADVLHPTGELEDPLWIREDSLPYDEMPNDYQSWLPSILGGYSVAAFIEDDENQTPQVTHGFRQKRNPLGRLEVLPLNPSQCGNL